MRNRLLQALVNLRRIFVPTGGGSDPDEPGNAGVRSPLKPRPVLVGSDAKAIPTSESQEIE
ncbi:MAG: hypothetical protein KY468_01740 [Armatimonadetes bacterium]|nr:hypothetical protein [Armatimonadota bacterium]